MVYIAEKQSPTTTSVHTHGKKSLETSFLAALEHARRLTQMYGIGSTEVAIAWETVEELVTAQHRQPKKSPSAFERYCSLHPDAPECRIYDV